MLILASASRLLGQGHGPWIAWRWLELMAPRIRLRMGCIPPFGNRDLRIERECIWSLCSRHFRVPYALTSKSRIAYDAWVDVSDNHNCFCAGRWRDRW